ncbi:MAG: adenosylcobinamide-phosphate synthase CbiB [Desulfobacterales bacterium]|nr:adenosylcobinamide-phosphate synthase CbiB [Desulfobacterales bacterium]
MTELPWYIFLAAFVLDLGLGDPRWLPHPIIWMGNAISFFEPRFRAMISNPFRAGLAFALFLITLTALISTAVVALAIWIHPLVGLGVQIILLFYCFSVKSLVQAARDVSAPLKAGDLDEARRMVGMIVGRETHSLDGPAVTRATVETVAENFVDGFLSPLCFALVFGVPGALTYKMINTLDSMVGYKNEKYILFGRAAARIDDGANFIPARLSSVVISLAALVFSPARGLRAWRTAQRDARAHKSPNAGFPEAAFAGALGVRMGGPNVYHGELVDKPYIGGQFPEPGLDRIDRACELMLMSALVGIGGACLIAVLTAALGGLS